VCGNKARAWRASMVIGRICKKRKKKNTDLFCDALREDMSGNDVIVKRLGMGGGERQRRTKRACPGLP